MATDTYKLNATEAAASLQAAINQWLKRRKIVIAEDADRDDLALLFNCLEDTLVAIARVADRQMPDGTTIPVEVINTVCQGGRP